MPHGNFGMEIDLSYLIFTTILGSNNVTMWMDKKKSALLDITEESDRHPSFFSAAKAGLVLNLL